MLNDFTPILAEKKTGLQIEPNFDVRGTTKHYDRSIEGQFTKVWSKLPNELINAGRVGKWQKLTKNCQRFLTGKKLKRSREIKTQCIDRINDRLDVKCGVKSNKSLSKP